MNMALTLELIHCLCKIGHLNIRYFHLNLFKTFNENDKTQKIPHFMFQIYGLRINFCFPKIHLQTKKLVQHVILVTVIIRGGPLPLIKIQLSKQTHSGFGRVAV